MEMKYYSESEKCRTHNEIGHHFFINYRVDTEGNKQASSAVHPLHTTKIIKFKKTY
jgi:hypothetical protein